MDTSNAILIKQCNYMQLLEKKCEYNNLHTYLF